MQPVLDDQRRDRRNLNHQMAHRLWIISLEQNASASAGIGVVFHHLIHPLDRQQLRPRSGMARLAAALAATALAPLWRLNTQTITGGRFGGVARAATNPHLQAGQLARQGGELAAEQLNLLMLGKDQLSCTSRPGLPVSSEIPAGGVLITSSLCLRWSWESSCRQGFSREMFALSPTHERLQRNRGVGEISVYSLYLAAGP